MPNIENIEIKLEIDTTKVRLAAAEVIEDAFRWLRQKREIFRYVRREIEGVWMPLG